MNLENPFTIYLKFFLFNSTILFIDKDLVHKCEETLDTMTD